ncbi:MAG TPA: hypothetical protein VH370_14880 [Humisphaera sp.]|jgi:hypothetical protein|nr:hypothetical protein [Humisphaera sp.]
MADPLEYATPEPKRFPWEAILIIAVAILLAALAVVAVQATM